MLNNLALKHELHNILNCNIISQYHCFYCATFVSVLLQNSYYFFFLSIQNIRGKTNFLTPKFKYRQLCDKLSFKVNK